METPYVTGIDAAGGSGDPSPMTALGVFQGIRAAAKKAYGSHKLEGLRVSMQGCGHVGSYLAQHLVDAGAILTVTDIHDDNVARVTEQTGATQRQPGEDLRRAGGHLRAVRARRHRQPRERRPPASPRATSRSSPARPTTCSTTTRPASCCTTRGILYAPDYVINAGGLINVSEELGGYNVDQAKKRVEKIYDNLTQRVRPGDSSCGIPPHEAAEKVALERIAMVRPIADVYTGRARTSWQHKPIALQNNG